MDNNLPADKQNIDNFNQYDEGTKEYLMEKYNISYELGDEEGELNYSGNRDNLRNFFIELDKLEINN